jgi:sugar/nucleoside kinase (ribokinase family)
MSVACVGILVADVFANPIRRLPEPGELTTTSGFSMSVGGCAANTAVALRILGREVSVAGKVGTDMFGDFVVSELTRRGIGIEQIRRTAELPTSRTIVFNVEREDRRYLHCIGANADLRLEDIDRSILDNSEVLYLGGYLALPSLMAQDAATLFREAKDRGVTTVLDVVMPAEKSFGIDDIAPVLRYTDFFLPNEDEAGRLTGARDAQVQAKCLGEINPECAIVITRGPLGSIASRRNRTIVTPPFPMDAVDESGAGDAFVAGLITGLFEGWDLERALLFASAIGGSCTRALGCYAGVFTFEEGCRLLEEQKAVA